MFKLKKSTFTAPHTAAPTLPEGERIYAIGDVHGRNDLLVELLQIIDYEAQGMPYRLVFLGDYIDRGPTSSGAIETLVNLKKSHPDTVFLMGNHEQVMLDFIAEPDQTEMWLDWGGLTTLESYGLHEPEMIAPAALRDRLVENMPDTHFNFLMDLLPWWSHRDFIFVHAGLRGGVELNDQSEDDLFWIRKDFYESDKKAWEGKLIVHGHTPVPKPQDAGWRVNVDTGAVWTGKLSALGLQGQHRWFVTT